VNLDDRSSNKNRHLWSRANLVAALRVLGSITAAVSPGGNSIPSVSLSISMLSPEGSSSSCRPTMSRSIIVLASFTLAQQLRQLRDIRANAPGLARKPPSEAAYTVLNTQLSLLPQFGHSKIRSSMPSSSGAMRAKFMGVEHFRQAGRMIVRGNIFDAAIQSLAIASRAVPISICLLQREHRAARHPVKP
jgi:hypothetical protein